MATLSVDSLDHTSDLILKRGSVEQARLTSSTIELPSINDGPTAGFRNVIVNGGFDVWQRGTSTSAPNAGFVADRWRNTSDPAGGNSGTRTFSRQEFTVGQTDVPGDPKYFLRWAESAVGTGYTYKHVNNSVENVLTFSGQEVTYSFYAKVSSGTLNVTPILGQNFGDGGSPSPPVYYSGSTTSVGTSWQRVVYTTTLGSVSGKTLGTLGTDSLWVFVGVPTNVTFTLDIANVQLERGGVATPFEHRDIATEVSMCQRYYQQRTITVPPSTSAPTSISFPTTMRATPSVENDGSAVTITSSSPRGFQVRMTSGAATTQQFTMISELL